MFTLIVFGADRNLAFRGVNRPRDQRPKPSRPSVSTPKPRIWSSRSNIPATVPRQYACTSAVVVVSLVSRDPERSAVFASSSSQFILQALAFLSMSLSVYTSSRRISYMPVGTPPNSERRRTQQVYARFGWIRLKFDLAYTSRFVASNKSE